MGGQQEKKFGQRERKEIMGFTVCHQKPSGVVDLMQNCDLPPPSKVFVGSDKTVMLSMNRVMCKTAGKDEEEEEENSKHYGTCGVESGFDVGYDGDKVELLKALRASQTRAREAQKRAAALRRERDGLSAAMVEEAMQLFAYRQQVRLLELQVLLLKSLQQQDHGMVEDDFGEERSSVTWVLALALTFGIGVTTAIACKYLL